MFSSGYLNKRIHRNDTHAYTHSFPLSLCLHISTDNTSNYTVNTISRTATFKNKDFYFVSLHGLYLWVCCKKPTETHGSAHGHW